LTSEYIIAIIKNFHPAMKLGRRYKNDFVVGVGELRSRVIVKLRVRPLLAAT
jgi:hypothetical protein